MADVKISGLPASTVPLAGTEVLPIVQGGATKQVSIANVTAGRAVSALSYAPTGSTVPANGLFLPAANAVGISTNSVEVARISATGGISIGNTIDPGATNLSVTGSTFSVTTTNAVTLGTPVTVYSFPNLGSGGDSSYMVTAGSNRGDATNFSAYAIIMTDAGTSRILDSALSVGVSISMSGLDLIITNGAGGTISVKTNILKLM